MKKFYFTLLGLLGLHLFFLANLKFTAWPEMLSYPYLRNNGFVLYRDLVHPYTPVLTMFLAIVFKVFGYRLEVLKLASWGMILTSDFLIFLIVRRLTKSNGYSLLALMFYTITQPFLEGNMLWPDLAIVPPILFGTLLLLKKRYFWAGISLAVAVLIKQNAGIFLIGTVLWLFFVKRDAKTVFYFLAGPVLLAATMIARLLIENALADFLNWTLIYPVRYWTNFPGYVQMTLSKRQLLILVLLLLPPIFLFIKKKVFEGRDLLLVFLSLISSVLLIYPRFSFFHFQTALSFSAILLAASVSKLKINTPLLILYCVLLFFVITVPTLKSDWKKDARFWDSESLEFADLIKSRVVRDERVYLLGPHSSLYALSDRIPPKPWADNFGWYFEVPGFQEKVIKRWDKDPPKKIIWQEAQDGNWFDLGVYRPKEITDWVEEHYTKKEELKPGIWLWERV